MTEMTGDTKNISHIKHLADNYSLDNEDLPDGAFLLQYKDIQRHQQKDKWLLHKLDADKTYMLRTVRGGGKTRTLIQNDGKIVLPATLQKRIVQWYHDQLCHPGEKRTENTIRQHFTFKGLSQMVKDLVSKCPICQKCKKTHTKYGKLPEKEAESEPWEQLCVDLIGPYHITTQQGPNKGKQLTLWCVTMIDPATGWFKMVQLPNKFAITVANIVEQQWLMRYPWPTIITYDKGTEFMAEFADMIISDYGITKQGATKRNPQANAIIERIHQTIGNIIRTFQIHSTELDKENPWNGLLAATTFATRATYHTTLQATPARLVFGRDAILNTKFEANWRLIKQRKQDMIRRNNKKENPKRVSHPF